MKGFFSSKKGNTLHRQSVPVDLALNDTNPWLSKSRTTSHSTLTRKKTFEVIRAQRASVPIPVPVPPFDAVGSSGFGSAHSPHLSPRSSSGSGTAVSATCTLSSHTSESTYVSSCAGQSKHAVAEPLLATSDHPALAIISTFPPPLDSETPVTTATIKPAMRVTTPSNNRPLDLPVVEVHPTHSNSSLQNSTTSSATDRPTPVDAMSPANTIHAHTRRSLSNSPGRSAGSAHHAPDLRRIDELEESISLGMHIYDGPFQTLHRVVQEDTHAAHAASQPRRPAPAKAPMPALANVPFGGSLNLSPGQILPRNFQPYRPTPAPTVRPDYVPPAQQPLSRSHSRPAPPSDGRVQIPRSASRPDMRGVPQRSQTQPPPLNSIIPPPRNQIPPAPSRSYTQPPPRNVVEFPQRGAANPVQHQLHHGSQARYAPTGDQPPGYRPTRAERPVPIEAVVHDPSTSVPARAPQSSSAQVLPVEMPSRQEPAPARGPSSDIRRDPNPPGAGAKLLSSASPASDGGRRQPSPVLPNPYSPAGDAEDDEDAYGGLAYDDPEPEPEPTPAPAARTSQDADKGNAARQTNGDSARQDDPPPSYSAIAPSNMSVNVVPTADGLELRPPRRWSEQVPPSPSGSARDHAGTNGNAPALVGIGTNSGNGTRPLDRSTSLADGQSRYTGRVTPSFTTSSTTTRPPHLPPSHIPRELVMPAPLQQQQQQPREYTSLAESRLVNQATRDPLPRQQQQQHSALHAERYRHPPPPPGQQLFRPPQHRNDSSPMPPRIAAGAAFSQPRTNGHVQPPPRGPPARPYQPPPPRALYGPAAGYGGNASAGNLARSMSQQAPTPTPYPDMDRQYRRKHISDQTAFVDGPTPGAVTRGFDVRRGMTMPLDNSRSPPPPVVPVKGTRRLLSKRRADF
ncbi:hypothetical protein FISHEDRAFT_73536 [Fistulina hepatica ATCC 64428]|uniref:Uncharacterized protein n=1 Tax=Fistulina hepatica ATCC 64428 TaxID=1128425 RepID=A0A0D7AC46_9AGAR|nr:hypothetical protein FISHEDRAFT_73536 [Fistulina hepatica ATCC 64428]